MKTAMLFPLLALTAGSACLAQSPISAKTSNIAVTIQTSSQTLCSFVASAASYSVDQTINPSATGAGAGRITFNPFTLVKDVDNCSGTLLSAAAAGTLLTDVFVVIAPPATAAGQSTYVVLLNTAGVQTLSESAAPGTTLQESVGLVYGALTVAEVNGKTVSNCHGFNRVTNTNDTAACATIQNFISHGGAAS